MAMGCMTTAMVTTCISQIRSVLASEWVRESKNLDSRLLSQSGQVNLAKATSQSVYLRSTPHPVTVTTRIITFLVGNPYKPPFATVTGWGVDLKSISLSERMLNISSSFHEIFSVRSSGHRIHTVGKRKVHQTFQVPKMEVPTYISCM